MIDFSSTRPPARSSRRLSSVRHPSTMAEMTRTMKIGPWFLRETASFAGPVLSRGNRRRTPLSIAMGYAGDMLFEIIQHWMTAPSVYRE